MRSLKMGRASYWRVKPTCSSCARGGRDFRCHCHGTGFFLECRQCGDEVRDNSGRCFAVSAGPGIHYDVCSEECLDRAIEEIAAMDMQPVYEVAS